MTREIRAVVFRFDPERDAQPRYDEYRINAAEQLSVLVLLNQIQLEIDPTLGFRSYCCGLQMCRACVMKVNHKKRLACITLVKPGDTVLIEPASFPKRHIRDLVVREED